ncbi:ABC transporter ATP-binding protein [Erysipelotrichaceae bacterium OttesenSCG-928-M19]|nr:ABC transporter ATP-binding protein [Erysipelotrichaceae bacterium OttesenSCG-928-M19]
MSSIKVENLSFYYQDGENKRYILDDISCEFNKGFFYTIVGHSGSGKTTFLSLLAGLDNIQQGNIYLDNINMQDINDEYYRSSKVGIVFQSYNLIRYLSAYENVLVAMDISQNELPEQKEAVAYNLLAYLGLNKDKANRLVTSLSGGEQQRVAIARLLAMDVDYILADEPTGNLDECAEQELVKIFQKLAHDHNKCVIVVTHSMDVARMSDVCLKLKRGRLSYE